MDLEQRIAKIEERNAKVEAEKAWETSYARAVSVAVLTYVIACVALFAISNDHPFRNALIPTIGFLLSMQSIPFLKRAWIKKYLKKRVG